MAGVPAAILSLAERFKEERARWPDARVRKILFGGESMYPDQRAWLESVFPGVQIRSIGYASVDAGLLGYSSLDCGPGEHRVFSPETCVEIVDDEGKVIDEPGRPGRLVVTSLTRTLMPIIRYPAGDRAAWLESSRPTPFDRKFMLMGRSEEAARIGPVSFYYEDVERALAPLKAKYGATAFQIVLTREELRDRLILRMATGLGSAPSATASAEIERVLRAERPPYASSVEKGLVHPVGVEWVRTADLEKNPRTGKLRRVIDQR